MAKKKKRKISVGDLIKSLGEDLVDLTQDAYVPSIMEFCESPDYLGMNENNTFQLYKTQRIILKVFYRGSIGNKELRLTEEEIEHLKDIGLWEDDMGVDRGNVLGKYLSGKIFNEMVLVWGRRSGKDFLASIIALYEAMKLIEVPGGDPYAYYNTAPGEPISILTVANSKGQAQICFNMIRERLRKSPYFRDKVLPEGLESQAIYLLTPRDKENNREYEERNEMTTKGSVVIEVGHSNSDTLLGKGCFVLILDEVASYTIGTGGSGSGERIYTAMSPTIATYIRRLPVFDEEGNAVMDEKGKPKLKSVYEGKKISISSPRGKEGKLWDLYESDPVSPNQLMCRLPTWDVNPMQERVVLREQYMDMSEEEFMMEFGAEFSGTAGENMFNSANVKAAFVNGLPMRAVGQPGHTYFAHLDPATNSHNYALVVTHREIIFNPESKQAERYIIVDHIKHWSPSPTRSIDIDEVDEYVINLRKRFHLGKISYDQWNSVGSIKKMQKAGIPAIMTPFNRKHKVQIYKELEILINSGRVKIPPYVLLKDEMLELRRRFDNNGFKVFPKKDGDGCKTDDVVDALAGACFLALLTEVNQLPKAKVVDTGGATAANQQVWMSMQGVPYGVGPGGAVSKNLERRNSWPQRKR